MSTLITVNPMKRQVRATLVVVIFALAAGWLALRHNNATMEEQLAARELPGEREVPR